MIYILSMTIPVTVPRVQGLVNVPVLGAPTGHLLHVALGYQLLQLGDLAHPVENAAPRHVEYLGGRVLAVLLGKQRHL